MNNEVNEIINHYKMLKAFVEFRHTVCGSIFDDIDFGEYMDYYCKGYFLIDCLYISEGEYPEKLIIYSAHLINDNKYFTELEGEDVENIPNEILADSVMLNMYVWDAYEKVRNAWNERDDADDWEDIK